MSGRKEFIERCKKENVALINDKNYAVVIRHKKKNGKPVGTVVAFKAKGGNNSIIIGASKCRKGDKFDRHIGIYQAIENSIQTTVDETKLRAAMPKEKRNCFPYRNLKMYFPLSMLGTVEEVIETVARRKSFVGN